MKYHFIPFKVNILKKRERGTITSVNEAMEKLEISCMTNGNVKLCDCIGKKNVAVPQNLNRVSIWTSSSIPKFILKSFFKMYLHKSLYTNIYSSIIHNRQKWKQCKMVITLCIDKQIVVYPYNVLLFGNNIWYKDRENIMLSERSQAQNAIYYKILVYEVSKTDKSRASQGGTSGKEPTCQCRR